MKILGASFMDAPFLLQSFSIRLSLRSKFLQMLIIDVKENSIERALKKYKQKYNRAGIMKELRRRKHFTKPSVNRRAELLKAEYKQKMYGNQ